MPQNSRLKPEGWRELMDAFGLSDNTDTYAMLIAAYGEKHRAYHTLDHINACFRHLGAVWTQCTRPHEIELALWFHDAVYKPFSAANEEDSAALAKTFLVQNNAAPDICERISDLIILTKDHAAPDSLDAQFMLDIDLSILGAERTVYEQFEKDVRREYKRVPAFMFKKKRREILRGFRDRPRIYHTDYFFERLEAQAKENLDWAIGRL